MDLSSSTGPQRLVDLVSQWPVENGAVGVTSASETLAVVGDTNKVFPLASVTKLLAGMCCWMAVEEEVLSYDTVTGPRDATLRHLLAHASGLAFDHAEPIARPATRRIYSNVGYQLIGETLANASGMSAAEYLNGMGDALALRSTKLIGDVASGAVSSVDDLLLVARELLAPKVFAKETVDEAISIAWPDLPGVLPGYGRQKPNPWGLGPEIRGHKDPHWTGSANSPETFGHFGRSGTFLWVDRVAGLAVVVLTDRDFDEWAKIAWPELSDEILSTF